MKRILTALGNPVLNNELRKYEKYELVSEDLFYQDAVIDFVETDNIDTIVISGLLQGQNDLIDFIEAIKRKNGVARIILIVDELSNESRKTLFGMGVFDILYDSEVEVKNVIEAIDREEPLAKCLMQEKSVEYDDNKKDYKVSYITKIQKQEVIAISGINGVGKSTFAVKFAKKLSSGKNTKILVIDMDTLTGNIEEIFGINKIPQNVDLLMDEDKKCGLNYAADLISKNRFDTNVLDELVIHDGGVDVLTGNTSLHYCQNVLKEEYYQKILTSAKEKYDFIIIDTSSNIFLDSTKWALQKSTKVIFVTENNYISMKKSTQLLNIFLNVWGIWKNKINIVVRKTNSNEIEMELVSKILQDLDVVGVIKNKDDVEYEKILEKINFVPKPTLKEKIEKVRQLIDRKSSVAIKEAEYAN